MSNDQSGVINTAAAGGVTGLVPAASPFQSLVAPATASEFNTVRLRLIPIACFRVDDIRFKFDSSFIVFDPSAEPQNSTPNDIRAEMEQLANLVKANPGAPLSIFGHADPVGADDYNKELSGRRAKAIYGLLTRDTDLWAELYSGAKSIAGDNWGNEALQTMQDATGLPSGTPQNDLFKAYMDTLCGADFQLQKTDFLGQGADSGGKGDMQGCGEFNPLLISSQDKQDGFDKASQDQDQSMLDERNAENAPNRRVMVLLFRPGSKIDPAKWPCPRVKEGVAGCKRRFFSDGEKRRSTRLPKDDRKFGDKKDTFACRFYQRISDNSPCESLSGRIRIYLDDPFLGFLPGVEVQVTYSGGATETLKTDKQATIGLLVNQGDFADLAFTTSLRKHTLRYFILLAGSSTNAGAWQRLVNLGYIHYPQPPAAPPDDDVLAAAIADFQASHGVDPTGELDGTTAQAIKDNHDQIVAWKDEQRTDLADNLASESASLAKDAVA